ncbi:MAG: hypothetical protein BWY77_00484 [bacterium ADurb.Bin431]|nr:MAG: hypothetical protein BWY77_00484 [bacterium ADurb.Bin431]
MGEIGDLADVAGEAGQFVQGDRRREGDLQLEQGAGDDRTEIGVAAALSVAVDRPLDVAHPEFERGEAVGHCDVAVVVGMQAERHLREALPHRPDDPGQPEGEGAAVGVAEDDAGGTRLPRGGEGAEGVLGIGEITVKKVFGVIDDLLAVVVEKGDRIADEMEVLLQGGAQPLDDMQVP